LSLLSFSTWVCGVEEVAIFVGACSSKSTFLGGASQLVILPSGGCFACKSISAVALVFLHRIFSCANIF